MDEYTKKRAAGQPGGASAGCVFRNPVAAAGVTTSAGAMLDRLGLKGLTVGGAMVSPKHANFIINQGGATAADIMKLIKILQAAVKENYGINLKIEIDIWN